MLTKKREGDARKGKYCTSFTFARLIYIFFSHVALVYFRRNEDVDNEIREIKSEEGQIQNQKQVTIDLVAILNDSYHFHFL